MPEDLTTVDTQQAVRNIDQRATAYQGGASNDIDQQVAAYIEQVEKVLEVRGVDRLQWLKTVRGQLMLRLHGNVASPRDERAKHEPLSQQRRIDYFSAVYDEIQRLLDEAESG